MENSITIVDQQQGVEVGVVKGPRPGADNAERALQIMYPVALATCIEAAWLNPELLNSLNWWDLPKGELFGTYPPDYLIWDIWSKLDGSCSADDFSKWFNNNNYNGIDVVTVPWVAQWNGETSQWLIKFGNGETTLDLYGYENETVDLPANAAGIFARVTFPQFFNNMGYHSGYLQFKATWSRAVDCRERQFINLGFFHWADTAYQLTSLEIIAVWGQSFDGFGTGGTVGVQKLTALPADNVQDNSGTGGFISIPRLAVCGAEKVTFLLGAVAFDGDAPQNFAGGFQLFAF